MSGSAFPHGPLSRRHGAGRSREGWLERAGRRGVLASLERLSIGRIVVHEDGATRAFGPADGALRVALTVEDPAFYAAIARGGSLGAAESWLRGEWRCDDLAALVELLARERAALGRLDGPLARLAGPAQRVAHALRRNTRRGSRRNIAAHYDLGNDFFAAFLDPTLTYSCAVFDSPGADLEHAQRAKYERLCRKLALEPGMEILEIGSGWGGFALHAAERHGCRVTTTTISRAQHERVREQIAEAGLEDRITLLLEDYRDLRGRFDRLVSIEMIEAVGPEYLDDYFRACSDRLAPDGRMALQAIVIAEQAYESARRSVDFIKRYVFPGGHLPSVGAMAASVARASDLRFAHLEDLTPHYVETLRRWASRFVEVRGDLLRRGYEERLLRVWEFYLRYCEGGFAARHIGLLQLVLDKPLCRAQGAGSALAGLPGSR
jgi:cyclopropane-fatty-acyl-phospholipid synthase